MPGEPVLARIAPGTFFVDVGGRREIVYVAGPPNDRWAFWNGHIFHSTGDAEATARHDAGQPTPIAHALSAPMPATVIRVLVAPGARVNKGDAVVLLEAMKMELAVRSLSDGTVTSVRCHDGELVQADQVLVELG